MGASSGGALDSKSPRKRTTCLIKPGSSAFLDVYGGMKQYDSRQEVALAFTEGQDDDGEIPNRHFETDGGDQGEVFRMTEHDSPGRPQNDHDSLIEAIDSRGATEGVLWDRREKPLVAPASMVSSSSSSAHGDAYSLARLLGGILGKRSKTRSVFTMQRRAEVFTEKSTSQVSACQRALLSVIKDFSDDKFISGLMTVIISESHATKNVKVAIKTAQTQVVEALGGDGVNSTKVMYIVFAALVACMEHQFTPKYSVNEVIAKYRPMFDSKSRRLSLKDGEKEWANIHRITNLIDVASSLVTPTTYKTAIFFACTYLGGDGNNYSTGGAMNPKSQRIYNFVLLSECQSKSKKSLQPISRNLETSQSSRMTSSSSNKRNRVTRSNGGGHSSSAMRQTDRSLSKSFGKKRLNEYSDSKDPEANARFRSKIRRNAKSTGLDSDQLFAVRNRPPRAAAEVGIMKRLKMDTLLLSSPEEDSPPHQGLEGFKMGSSDDVPQKGATARMPLPQISPHGLESVIGSIGSLASPPALTQLPVHDDTLFDDFTEDQLQQELLTTSPNELFTDTSTSEWRHHF